MKSNIKLTIKIYIIRVVFNKFNLNRIILVYIPHEMSTKLYKVTEEYEITLNIFLDTVMSSTYSK